MTPYYADPWLTVYAGDCRAVMAEMPEQSVDCVVTSPPYWGLRDYGAEGQIGLEPTPEAYVETMVAVFREVRRVLRDDGTVWLNLGDSYTSGNSGQRVRNSNGGFAGSDGERTQDATRANPGRAPVGGAKPKDLVGIPWRVAFALQADGWYLRSDVVWSKPNPMPESVTDRPTKSHEYVFLLSKRERYYFDSEAVRLPVSPNWQRGAGPPVPEHGYHVLTEGRTGHQARRVYDEAKGANIRSVWTIATQPYPGAHFATFPEALVEPCVKAGSPMDGVVLDCFAGSGTTGRVAQRLGRRAILIDLSPAYLVQAMARNRDIPLGLGFGPTEDAA